MSCLGKELPMCNATEKQWERLEELCYVQLLKLYSYSVPNNY